MFRQIFQLSINPAPFAPQPCWRSVLPLLGPVRGLCAGDWEMPGGSNLLPLAGTLGFKWGVGVDSASLRGT